MHIVDVEEKKQQEFSISLSTPNFTVLSLSSVTKTNFKFSSTSHAETREQQLLAPQLIDLKAFKVAVHLVLFRLETQRRQA